MNKDVILQTDIHDGGQTDRHTDMLLTEKYREVIAPDTAADKQTYIHVANREVGRINGSLHLVLRLTHRQTGGQRDKQKGC